MNSSTFSALLARQVTRKEFILYLGTVLIALLGIKNILKIISISGEPKTPESFGFGPYGGGKANK